MEKLSFRLEVFEGPLDLLLKLLSKNKINIYDIPVAQVLDQYLESIDGMEDIDMDTASEFITMAAYLVFIKSKMLLPTAEEEEEDPRENLVRMLLEYKKYKQAAAALAGIMADAPLRAVRAPMHYEAEDEAYDGRHSLFELGVTYAGIFKKARRRMPPPITEFKGIVNAEYTPISVRVMYVLRRLLRNESIMLADAFEGSTSRSDVVATFLAVLELISKHEIMIKGSGKNVSLTIRKDRKKYGA